MVHHPAELHGLLVVDKPAGWTSHDVVGRVRRLAGQRQVGHAGTLDPLATGLLVLGLGRGTRVLEYVLGSRKTYRAQIRLGAATDTYDADGQITATAPWDHVSAVAIATTLQSSFVGEVQQRPPAFSAIKRGGVPLYKLARRGEAVEVEPRAVTIYDARLLNAGLPEFEVEVTCSAGTYIRSLAHDLGAMLGSAAHLVALRRTRIGSLTLTDACTLEDLSAEGRAIADRLLAVDRPLLAMPAMIVSADRAASICHGQQIEGARALGAPIIRAYGVDGTFLALMAYDTETSRWRTHKVFASGDELSPSPGSTPRPDGYGETFGPAVPYA